MTDKHSLSTRAVETASVVVVGSAKLMPNLQHCVELSSSRYSTSANSILLPGSLTRLITRQAPADMRPHRPTDLQ
jgi:hypothetical protein